MARQTSLLDAIWIPAKDGNPTGMDIFLRHYTARSRRKVYQFFGPGEKMVLLTPSERKYRLKLSPIMARLEVKTPHGWVRIKSGYYKDLSFTPDGKIAGLGI
jgi:hypothetical protein